MKTNNKTIFVLKCPTSVYYNYHPNVENALYKVAVDDDIWYDELYFSDETEEPQQEINPYKLTDLFRDVETLYFEDKLFATLEKLHESFPDALVVYITCNIPYYDIPCFKL